MKRLLTLFMLAALMLSLTACGEKSSAGLSEHDTGNDLTQSNSDPTPVTEPELTSFEKLFRYGPLPAADENGLWGFIDSTGTYVISPAYLEAERFGKDGLALVQDQNGLYGYLDPSGQFAIAPQFESAHSFSNGLAVASGDGGYGYIDTSGSFVIAPQFFEAYNFAEGLAVVRVGDYISGLYGYIDSSGDYAIEPRYLDAFSFYDGVAAVTPADGTRDQYYLIDASGVRVTDFTFSVSSRTYSGDGGREYIWFSEGWYPARLENSMRCYINPEGKLLQSSSGTVYVANGSSFSEGLAPALSSETGFWGCINLQREWVIAPEYGDIGSFSNGLAIASSTIIDGGDYCYRIIDAQGNVISDFPFPDYFYDENGTLKSELYGIEPVSLSVRELLPVAEYQGSYSRKFGYMDQNWNVVIDCIYDQVGSFSLDMSYAKVQLNGLWGMIDRDGNWLIPANFKELG